MPTTPGSFSSARATWLNSIFLGVPASVIDVDSSNSPHVPQRITAATTKLTSGSIHRSPVSKINKPATTTAADTAASATMCR